VPFELPADIADKLTGLFAHFELNTGSVDLILDEAGRYVFLEINPTGQYGPLQEICNYDISQTIARWLTATEMASC
jgi:glutathione synthase/RimK-type ligase-like ATP-grasp enzyme